MNEKDLALLLGKLRKNCRLSFSDSDVDKLGIILKGTVKDLRGQLSVNGEVALLRALADETRI